MKTIKLYPFLGGAADLVFVVVWLQSFGFIISSMELEELTISGSGLPVHGRKMVRHVEWRCVKGVIVSFKILTSKVWIDKLKKMTR